MTVYDTVEYRKKLVLWYKTGGHKKNIRKPYANFETTFTNTYISNNAYAILLWKLPEKNFDNWSFSQHKFLVTDYEMEEEKTSFWKQVSDRIVEPTGILLSWYVANKAVTYEIQSETTWWGDAGSRGSVL